MPPCSCPLCSGLHDPATLSKAQQAVVMLGEHPPGHFTQRILEHVVQLYPSGGNQLEAAIAKGISMGWRGHHELVLQAATDG